MELEEIKKQITRPKNKTAVNKAIIHQNRIKFHTEPEIINTFVSQALTDFLKWVGTLIPKEKFFLFKTLFQFPVKTNELAGTCFDKLSRVFDGKNPAFNYQFMNSEQRDDWEYYRQNVLKEPDVWKTKGWKYFKTEINSVLIVDMPIEPDPLDKYPQPYFYWLTIDKVISYKANPDTGVMDYIIFYQGEDKIAVFDKYDFEVYQYDRKENRIGTLISSNPHSLGYCPARFFFIDPIKLNEPDVKSHPFTKGLSALDWYLFFSISKKQLDLYGAYPIYSGYEPNCNFEDEDHNICDGGFLMSSKGTFLIDGAGGLTKCPKCSGKRIAGVGSFIEIPIPGKTAGGDEMPDLRNPVQMLTVDSGSLNYNVEEEQRLESNFINSTVGISGDSGLMNTQALNETQVSANFENQNTVLNRIKTEFEGAQKWVDETVCILRYGNSFVSAGVNYGTEFYTLSASELREKYKTAKESGASEGELDAMLNQIIETEYRHNPTQLQRMIILSELENYRHLTRSELIELQGKGLISDDELYMKINFNNFVKRFERENTNVLEFGTGIPYDKKINIINNKFKEYASENRKGDEGRQDN